MILNTSGRSSLKEIANCSSQRGVRVNERLSYRGSTVFTYLFTKFIEL